MKTLAFVMFVLVTAAAAVVATLLATRYWSLEKQLNEVRAQVEELTQERNHQEQEKMLMRLDREHIQTELETKLAEQRDQIDECTALHQKDMAEVLSHLATLEKQMNDAMSRAAPSAVNEPPAQPGPSAQEQAPQAEPAKPAEPPAKAVEPAAKATDVPHGAIPTPEQERQRLQKVSP
jgi:uncharacterized protein (DUF3084 family)